MQNGKKEGKDDSESFREQAGLLVHLAGIALGGLPAKVQPHEQTQPGRRCVETSDDVTVLGLRERCEKCQYIFLEPRKSYDLF